MTGARPTVTVYVASLDTAVSTELCIRSMRARAGYPFSLVVGDCGSSDGSLDMLQRFAERGWLTLEVAPEGRMHAGWLDDWMRRPACDYAVACDSDIEFRRRNWLADMVRRAQRCGAALVAAEMTREGRNFIEPVGLQRVRLARRPAPWLLLLDVAQTAGIDTSFTFKAVHTDTVPEGTIAYDVGGYRFNELLRRGLRHTVMPPWFRLKYRHYGSMSWATDLHTGAKQSVAVARLDRLRHVQETARSCRG